MKLLTAALMLILAMLAGSAGATLVPVEQIYDFGAVAIEFSVAHDFKFVNVGNTTIRIDSARSDCDCTITMIIDSVAGPNDTAVVRVVFETTNFYGRISKLMNVYTSERGHSPLQVYYLATVGQWLYGIKPNPISAFFLPPQKSKTVAIMNPVSPLMEVAEIQPHDNLMTIRPLSKSAGKDGKIEFEVVPREKLGAGTYVSNFRVTLKVRGAPDPLLITIPVKIVRY
jgi:hypothetical protein